MTGERTVGILGLGLIGGSIARALARKGVNVLAFDADAASLEAARESGVVSSVLDTSLAGLSRADWVIISVPVQQAISLLQTVSERAPNATLITDTGSTKRSILAEASRLGIGDRFVGSHPMAGSERSGWSASRADLFVGATTYLCTRSDSAGTNESKRAFEAATNLWTLLGARPERISAENHDALVAATSHVPHMLSTSLALTLAELAITADELGAGGRDMVRIAAGDATVWEGILLDNRDEVLSVTDLLLEKLTDFRTALGARDAGAVRDFLQRGRAWTAARG